jgi:hypothetical protein
VPIYHHEEVGSNGAVDQAFAGGCSMDPRAYAPLIFAGVTPICLTSEKQTKGTQHERSAPR